MTSPTGKPAKFLFEQLCSNNLGIDKEKTVMIGDSLASDIGFAKSKLDIFSWEL